VRGGFIYNTSDYTRFDNGKYEDNYGLFALGDYQVYQPYKASPYRGIMLGASAFYANPEVNVISQYYEARLYTVGLFESRPVDGITLNLNHSTYSSKARNSVAFQDVNAPAGQLQTTVSYSAHIIKGLYLSPNLSYVHHPAFGDYNDALTVGVNLFLNF
jgi:carbohydrate-selective porin OprB